MIDHTSILQLSTEARHQTLGDEGVVLLQTAGEVMVVNELGSRTLTLLDKPTSVGKLLDQLQHEYQVARETLQQDVLTYLNDLLAGGVIEPVPNTKAP